MELKKIFFISEKADKKLTVRAKNSLAQAYLFAKKFNHHKIEHVHLFYSIFLEKGSLGSVISHDLGIKKEFFKNYFKKSSLSQKTKPQKVQLEESFSKTLTKAFSAARKLNCGYVGTEHLLYAILESQDPKIKKIILKLNSKKEKKFSQKKNSFKKMLLPDNLLNFGNLLNLTEKLSDADLPGQAGKESVFPDFFPKDSPAIETKTSAYMEKFCSDMNKKVAKKKEDVIGREDELERIVSILGRKNKNNPLLIGSPGVGKTALVQKLAERINANEVPDFLQGKKIMNLDVAGLVAGTSFRGEFEARLKEIIKEATLGEKTILFIDEIHNIVGAGNISGSLDLANILKPSLAEGDLRLIGATTFSEYKRHIEKDPALERRFQPVTIKEPTIREAKKIISGIKVYLESFHNVSIGQDIANMAVDLSKRYIKNRFLPDKAIDILDETASGIRAKNKPCAWTTKIREIKERKDEIILKKEKLISEERYEEAIALRDLEKKEEEKINFLKIHCEAQQKKKRREIKPGDIFKTIARITGISQEKLAGSKGEKIRNISKIMSSKIIGQKEVVKRISSALKRSQSGIENPERPLGSFLFMGPTGVGKTLTAKILAQEFFSDDQALVRIDMSEFSERHSISSLIGSPVGYVGYGEGGRLTEKIRKNPYCVVLFDELEKAHPDVANILLQILEDGILTDAEGLEVDFKNTIIIITTNIGTGEFCDASRIGFESEKNISLISQFQNIKEKTIKELENKIKPEIIDRLDHTLVFNPLGKKEISQISALELDDLKLRLKKQNIDLQFGSSVSNFIAQKSFTANQGARLVRKNIREIFEDPIAEMIVFKKVKEGRIKAEVKKGKLKLI